MWTYRYPKTIAVPSDGVTEKTSSNDLALTLDDALMHIKADAGIEDSYILSLVRSIQDDLEPPNGWLGRSLTTATYKLVLPWFARRIKLAGSPIQSVDSITYRDSDGVVQTVDSGVYRLTGEAIPSIVEVEGKEWPTDLECVNDAVTIEYTAGFGDESDVPEIIKEYIRIMTAYRYDQRKPVMVGTGVVPMPYARDMLESWRIHL